MQQEGPSPLDPGAQYRGTTELGQPPERAGAASSESLAGVNAIDLLHTKAPVAHYPPVGKLPQGSLGHLITPSFPVQDDQVSAACLLVVCFVASRATLPGWFLQSTPNLV